MESKISEFENLKIRNIKFRNFDIRNLNIPNLKIQNLKLRNLNIGNFKIQDLNILLYLAGLKKSSVARFLALFDAQWMVFGSRLIPKPVL